MDPKTVQAVLDDPTRAPISDRLRAGLSLVEALTLHSRDRINDAMARARSQGLDDAAIEDAANVAFHFNLMNRVADAFDFKLPARDKTSTLANTLDWMKRFASRKRPSPSWQRAGDGTMRPVEVQHIHEALLGAPGAVSPELRGAVEAHTARVRGGSRPNLPVPEDLKPYLEKLALHAYRITDQDVESLAASGYSKDAIFEITLAGAWGASVVALEHLFVELHTVRLLAA